MFTLQSSYIICHQMKILLKKKEYKACNDHTRSMIKFILHKNRQIIHIMKQI